MERWREPPSLGWKTFLRNHAPRVAAIDLLVVPTIGSKLLYGLAILNLERRRRLAAEVAMFASHEKISNLSRPPRLPARPGRRGGMRGRLDQRRLVLSSFDCARKRPRQDGCCAVQLAHQAAADDPSPRDLRTAHWDTMFISCHPHMKAFAQSLTTSWNGIALTSCATGARPG